MNAAEYCQDKAAKSGSSFYYSFLFLPGEQRHAITALYAFCREVDDVVDECSEPAIAQQKLHWWIEEVHRIFHGQPQHPVGLALQTSCEHFDLKEQHLNEIVEGMLMDVDKNRYRDFQELSVYCYRVAGVVGLLAAEIFGYSDAETLVYAEKLGLAFQLTNILRDVKEDAARGRIYLPLKDLERFNVTENDLLNSIDGPAVRALLRFQGERAEQCYRDAFSHLPEKDRFNQRSGLIMSAIYHALLEEISSSGFDIFNRPVRISPLKKLWIAWRTSRRENRRHKYYLKNES